MISSCVDSPVYVSRLTNTSSVVRCYAEPKIFTWPVLFMYYVFIAATIVENQFRYGDVVWGSLSRAKLAALQRLQTRALKIIRNANVKDTWLCPGMNIENITCFDRNVMTYKIMHNLCQK